MTNQKNPSFHFADKLWDLWCIVSVIGIWPRFIEPHLLVTTKLNLPVLDLPGALKGLKIVQFSDLHLNKCTSERFLKKLQRKIKRQAPDIIVFTGDFLCYSELAPSEELRLKEFLTGLSAPFGCYAIFGNHDYEKCVSINDEGSYDLIDKDSSLISKGFKRLFFPPPLKGIASDAAKNIKELEPLCHLLEQTPFELLNNRCKTVKIHNSYLNLCGVGEHMLGRCDPKRAFQNYKTNFPGIILAHNPDCIPSLKSFPGNIILSGHTHGAQVNLPWIWRKLVIMENMQYKRGLFKEASKWAYVNRGVGSAFPFRWFSIPEILLLTLE